MTRNSVGVRHELCLQGSGPTSVEGARADSLYHSLVGRRPRGLFYRHHRVGAFGPPAGIRNRQPMVGIAITKPNGASPFYTQRIRFGSAILSIFALSSLLLLLLLLLFLLLLFFFLLLILLLLRHAFYTYNGKGINKRKLEQCRIIDTRTRRNTLCALTLEDVSFSLDFPIFLLKV